MKQRIILMAFLVLALAGTAAAAAISGACGGNSTTATQTTTFSPGTTTGAATTTSTSIIAVTDLSSRQGFDMVQANRDRSDFVILDVRTPDEYNAGHIEGAINVEYDYASRSFRGDVGALDKGKTYLVYCLTGIRSKAAAGVMAGLGFEHICNLLGGITAWQANGYPVMK